ncbi:MAG: thioesterase family protein [Lysinibacillus sp.]
MKASYIDDFKTWANDFTFSTQVRVRFSETDMFGHLNNTVPFTYFELARIEYLKHVSVATWSKQTGDNILVVADLQCDFLKQVFFDELLTISVKAAKVGNSSIDLHYLTLNEAGEPVFVGRGTVVQISKTTGKPVAWTEEERQVLNGSTTVL